MPQVSADGGGRRRRPLEQALMGLSLAFLLVACGYHPLETSGLVPSGRRVRVDTITNETFRPGIEAIVSGALLRQLRLRGVLRSPETGPPDLVLSGGVTAYQNDAIAFDSQDVGQRFRVRVTLLTSLIERADSKVRLREAIVGEAFYTAGTGVVAARNAEDQALRFAAQDLASKVVARLLEEW